MDFQTIPTMSIVGMIFSLIISFALPITLLVIVLKKNRGNAKISSFFIGCGTFFLFALVLEQIMHFIVLTVTGDALKSNVLLYGLYGGLAAAVFEETGRFLAMKYLMKKNLTRENALTYGVGHGGIEAILLIGMTYVSNIVISLMINAGQFQKLVAETPEISASLVGIEALWTTPSVNFFIGGVERIFAVTAQIAFSVLVFYSIKHSKKLPLFFAYLLHFTIDFAAVALSSFCKSLIVLELAVALIAGVAAYIAFRLYKKDCALEEASSPEKEKAEITEA